MGSPPEYIRPLLRQPPIPCRSPVPRIPQVQRQPRPPTCSSTLVTFLSSSPRPAQRIFEEYTRQPERKLNDAAASFRNRKRRQIAPPPLPSAEDSRSSLRT